MSNTYVFDIEVYNNLSFLLYKKVDDPKFQYLNLLRNRNKISEWLNTEDIFVGFNILNFDIPIILISLLNPDIKQSDIVDITNKIIDKDSNDKREILKHYLKDKTKDYYSFIKKLKLIDLYTLHKWDDDSRRASLKWVAMNLNFTNVMSNPFGIEHNIKDKEELKKVIEYCYNDLLETERVYKYSLKDIEMRTEINNKLFKGKRYNLLSQSNTSVGSSIIMDYVYKMKPELKDVKVFPSVKYIFDIPTEIAHEKVKKELDKIIASGNLEIQPYYKTTVHRNKEHEHSIVWNNPITKEPFIIKLAKGGGHGFYSNSIVLQSNDEYIIEDFDVASYYPSIVESFGFYPSRIGEVFLNVYKTIKEERFKYPKSHPFNKGFKESLNSAVGKSNFPSDSSPFFDPQFFFRVTINGQLMLYILLNKLKELGGIEIVSVNTDGGTIMRKRNDENKVKEIYDWWQDYFGVKLEFTYYDKLVGNNVNSYVASKIVKKYEGEPLGDKDFVKDGYLMTMKCKGEFVWAKDDIELHKNNSFRIIPKAICNYFMKAISVTETIMSEQDIFMFLGMERINSNTQMVLQNNKGEFIDWNQKIIRYSYTYNEPKYKVYRKGKNGLTILDKEYPDVSIFMKVDKNDINKINKKVFISMVNSKIRTIQHEQVGVNLFTI